jgi:hypothetical protein
MRAMVTSGKRMLERHPRVGRQGPELGWQTPSKEQNTFHLIGMGIPLIAMVPGVKVAPLQKAEFLFLRISRLFFPTIEPRELMDRWQSRPSLRNNSFKSQMAWPCSETKYYRAQMDRNFVARILYIAFSTSLLFKL